MTGESPVRGHPSWSAESRKPCCTAKRVAGGYDSVTLEAVTRPVRLGDDADDVTRFITSLPEATKLFAGKPKENVAAAIDGLRDSLAPHARSSGVIMKETAWLASAHK
jgi:hypothetical protein